VASSDGSAPKIAREPLSRELDEAVARVKELARARARTFVWDPAGRAGHAAAPPPRRPAPRRPLQVLLSDAGKSLFSTVQDSRVQVIRSADLGQQAPDVLVVPRADRLRLEESCKELPAAVWDRLRAGHAKLVFDASGEGNPHKWGRTAILHEFLRQRGLSADAAAYVTQDRGYPIQYSDYCDGLGLGDNRMRIWIFDRYIQGLFADVEDTGEQLFAERLALYATRGPCRARRFISLNYTVRPAKALFLMSLLKDGLWDQGFISVGDVRLANGGRRLSRSAFLNELHSCRGLEHLIEALEPYLDELERRAPTTLGVAPSDSPKALRRALLAAAPLAEYQQSWFTVVVDSHVSDRMHRITEKPFKPMLNFHPMILLGAVGAMRLVRAYGFQDYPGLVDKSRDEVPVLRSRFESVYGRVERLCRIEERKLARLDAAVRDAVLFNAWWGLVELPKLFHSHIEAAVVDQLLEFVRIAEAPCA
jgi:hypothetical protein